MMKGRVLLVGLLLALGVSGCVVAQQPATQTPVPTLRQVTQVPSAASPNTPGAIASAAPTATASPLVPAFEHIIIIVFENKEFGTVVDNPDMPYFNQLAKSYTLLTQYYAVIHPSLPNYLAMIGGDTFGITSDCTNCPRDAPTLPDLIEASGRTWKAYEEDMPSPCFEGADYRNYAMKHDPFIYFKAIHQNAERCTRSIVPLSQLAADIAAGALPNYIFITPNQCNDAHDCPISTADKWLKTLMQQLQPPLEAEGKPYLIVLTWDEGQGNHSCCGLPQTAGGRIATILVSPQVKSGFQDGTPYTHYSLLKTIAASWNLLYLGHAADPENVLITAPWK